MLKKYLERKAQKLSQEVSKRQRKYDEALVLTTDKYNKDRENMLQKPCPFVNMQHCTDKCVHFSEGKIILDWWDDFLYDFTYNCSCKLWIR